VRNFTSLHDAISSVGLPALADVPKLLRPKRSPSEVLQSTWSRAETVDWTTPLGPIAVPDGGAGHGLLVLAFTEDEQNPAQSTLVLKDPGIGDTRIKVTAEQFL
jgi:hypothetical protein